MLRTFGVVLACALALTACSEAPGLLPSTAGGDSPRRTAEAQAGAPSGSPSTPTEDATPEPAAATSDLLVTGNSFWGRYIQQRSAGDTSWPFQGLKGFKKSDYDAWVTGLECPAVNSEDPFELQETILKFHCKPSYLPQAAKWFDIVSLANNHTDNQGPEGLEKTRSNLDRAGIAWFGDPDPEVLDQVCKPIAVKVRTDTGTPGALPVAFCGHHGVFQTPSQASIDQISEWSDRIPVIAMPHSGLEYEPAPDSMKVALYRAFIDAGADVVLGDHAHWVQTSEAYKGRLIVYNMGNFMFDQQGNPEVRRSAAIHVRISSEDPHLASWLQVGAQCEASPTECGRFVTKAKLPGLKASWQFGVVGTTNPEMITRPASATETAAIRERLKWAQTMAGLTGNQGPLNQG